MITLPTGRRPSLMRSTPTMLRTTEGVPVLSASVCVVPSPVPADAECLIAAVSSIGRLLLFEMDELPELAKGKGNKLLNIPGPKYKSGEEPLVAAAVVPEDGSLQVHTGTRVMTIKWNDVDDYYGDRALRGSLLPKGWRKVQRLIGCD